MDTKEAFEKWAEEVGALPWGYLGKQRTASGNYSVQIYTYMWKSWQASRAAIEIDLPYNDVISDETDEQWDKAVDACSEAITSHGIRIKGKTE